MIAFLEVFPMMGDGDGRICSFGGRRRQIARQAGLPMICRGAREDLVLERVAVVLGKELLLVGSKNHL